MSSKLNSMLRACATGAAVLALGANVLSAQITPADADGESIVRLPSLDVTSWRDASFIDDRSTVGSKISAPLLETPQSISIITADLIRDQNAQNMQEVLRYTAGVRAEMYGLDNRGDWFTLRGGSEGSTLLDGLRLPLSGWWGVVRNEPFAFERVEVLRGPSSVMAGQNGPGGVVNLISKRPRAHAGGEINVQLGNFNHQQLSADVTGPLTGDGRVLYRVVGLVKDADTQVDHAFDERELLAPSLTWRINDATSWTVFAEYQRDESGNIEGFFPWEGTLFPAPNGFIPSETFIGEPEWDTYGGKRLRFGHEVEHRLNNDWRVRHHFRYDHVNGDMVTMYAAWWDGFVDETGAPDPTGRYLNRLWYANHDEGRIYNSDVLVEGNFATGATQHTVLFGVDGMSATNRNQALDGPATPLDVYTPTYSTFARPELSYGPATETRTRQLGFLVQDQIRFGERWIVSASLRHDRVKTTVDGSTEQGNDDNAWSKNVGLVYRAGGGWAPYVSYAESFEAVSGTDAAQRAFRPRRGEQIEAGVKWSPSQSFLATAAVYDLKEDGRLTDDPDNVGFSVQRGEVSVRGVELEAFARIRSWNLVANYTYTDAEQTKSSDPADVHLGKRLHSIPEHSASLWATHSFALPALRGLSAGAGVRFVGETWDGTDTVRTPSNTLADAVISYTRDRWRYALNVTNVFDKDYVVTALERGDAWFGGRREIVGTASYRW